MVPKIERPNTKKNNNYWNLFCRSEGNKYSLGPRTFLELGSFLEGLEGLDEVLKAKMEALH